MKEDKVFDVNRKSKVHIDVAYFRLKRAKKEPLIGVNNRLFKKSIQILFLPFLPLTGVI
jgi:hypothetical protein